MPNPFTKVLESVSVGGLSGAIENLVDANFDNPDNLIAISDALAERHASAHKPLRIFPPFYARPFQERCANKVLDQELLIQRNLETEIAEFLSLSLIDEAEEQLKNYKESFGVTLPGFILETSLAWMKGEVSLRDIFPGGSAAVLEDSKYYTRFQSIKGKIYEDENKKLKEYNWRNIYQLIQMYCGEGSIDDDKSKFIQSSVICALTAAHVHTIIGFTRHTQLQERISAYGRILPNPQHLKYDAFPEHSAALARANISTEEHLWEFESKEYKALLRLRPQTFQWENPENERIISLDTAWVSLLELRGQTVNGFSLVEAVGISYGKSLLSFALENRPKDDSSGTSLHKLVFGKAFDEALEKQRNYVALNPTDPCSDQTIRSMFIIESLLEQTFPLTECGILGTWLELAEIPKQYAVLAAWYFLGLNEPESRPRAS